VYNLNPRLALLGFLVCGYLPQLRATHDSMGIGNKRCQELGFGPQLNSQC
jgi:hypothetical protein